jgi:hypothetical protein
MGGKIEKIEKIEKTQKTYPKKHKKEEKIEKNQKLKTSLEKSQTFLHFCSKYYCSKLDYTLHCDLA